MVRKLGAAAWRLVRELLHLLPPTNGDNFEGRPASARKTTGRSHFLVTSICWESPSVGSLLCAWQEEGARRGRLMVAKVWSYYLSISPSFATIGLERGDETGRGAAASAEKPSGGRSGGGIIDNGSDWWEGRARSWAQAASRIIILSILLFIDSSMETWISSSSHAPIRDPTGPSSQMEWQIQLIMGGPTARSNRYLFPLSEDLSYSLYMHIL